MPQKRRGLSSDLAASLDQDRKAHMDWADPAARGAQLKLLATDAEAVLDLALAQADDPEVRAAARLLNKTLGDDLVSDDAGNPQIGQGVAADRIVSLTDPEMRHGRKSTSQRFDGRKLQVAEEQSSERLVAVEPVPANVGERRDLLPVIEQVEAQAGVRVERAIADGPYGSGDNPAA